MARPPAQQPVASMDGLLHALRNPKGSVRAMYLNDPVGLATKLHLKLPEKPLVIMQRLGVYDPDKHGPIVPGIRDLVMDVCSGDVTNAVAAATRGGGKGATLSSLLPTPTGWTTMGEVQVGDYVMAADGTPTRVVWKSDEFYEDVYEVEFDDGQVIVAGQNHQWLTEDAAYRIWRSNRRRTPLTEDPAHNRIERKPEVRLTTDILDTIQTLGEKRGWSPNHTIRNSEALQLPEAYLPVDPYILGLWLGDGGRGTEIIGADVEDAPHYIQPFESAGYSVKESLRNDPNRRAFNVMTIKGLKQDLIAAGCFSHKHIPAEYLRASIEQRLALIQGLMDTDGTTRATNNNCQFGQKDDDLVMQFAELVASMGWKYTINLKQATCQTGARYKYLLCSFNPDRQVYRLPRKAARLNITDVQRCRIDRRYVVDVRQVERVPLQCIQVSHPDHLYLIGDGMIPTHNSQGVSFIEFFLVFLKDYDALNLGGSELQADQVYQYIMGYVESHPDFKAMIKGEALQSKTETLMNAWIRVLTASSKSVRSPHAGGRKKDGRLAGGLLVIDEEAEAAPEIVEAALPTINTARPSVSVRVSTFHNAEGSFAEVMDNAEEMGYKKYHWDIFDVAERCDCTGAGCQSEEVCFREDHIEEYIDPDTGEEATRLLHKAYCNGRAKYADGWIPMTEIIQLWKRFRRNHSRWEVEAMGSRPSTKGFVIKDRTKWSECTTELDGDQVYMPGWPVTITVDWGTVAAGLECWQEQPGDKHVLIHCEQVEEAGDTQIIGKILGLQKKFSNEFKEVAADIGGGGNYLNPKLREEYGIRVRDVNFGQEKEAAVAAWNIYNEAEKCVYPAEFITFHQQAKNWKRKAGHIQKGNDHLMDASICYFAAFVDRLGLQNVHVAPRGFSAGGPTPSQERASSMRETEPTGFVRSLVGARPMVRTIGSRRR